MTGIILLGLLAGCGETPTDPRLERLATDQSLSEFFGSEAFPEDWSLVCVLGNYESAAKSVEKQFGAGWKAVGDPSFYSGDYLSIMLIDEISKKYAPKEVIVERLDQA